MHWKFNRQWQAQSDDNSSHGLSYQMRKKQNILGSTRYLGLTNKQNQIHLIYRSEKGCVDNFMYRRKKNNNKNGTKNRKSTDDFWETKQWMYNICLVWHSILALVEDVCIKSNLFNQSYEAITIFFQLHIAKIM